MKAPLPLSQTVYDSIKYKIECGIYPCCTPLPSSEEICRIYSVSDKTVRRVMKRLSEDGLIKTTRGRRPEVIYSPSLVSTEACLPQPASPDVVQDIIHSACRFFCPVVQYGVTLCTQEDFAWLESLVNRMEPDNETAEYWNISRQFWRFFPAKTGNDVIVRCIDSLGYLDLIPMPLDTDFKRRYRLYLTSALSSMRNGEFNTSPSSFFSLRKQLIKNRRQFTVRNPDASEPFLRPDLISSKIEQHDGRISAVYVGLISDITLGLYRPGDQIPTHKELCLTYQVSHDSTVRAIRYLREQGIISSVRGHRMFVSMAAEDLPNIWKKLDSVVVCRYYRVYIDALEALSLSIRHTASHAAETISPSEAAALRDTISRELHLGNYRFCPLKKVLELILSHIELKGLRQIYTSLLKYAPFDLTMPELIRSGRQAEVTMINTGTLEAVTALADGSPDKFVRLTVNMFHTMNHAIFEHCKALGYLEDALTVYDGTLLWK